MKPMALPVSPRDCGYVNAILPRRLYLGSRKNLLFAFAAAVPFARFFSLAWAFDFPAVPL